METLKRALLTSRTSRKQARQQLNIKKTSKTTTESHMKQADDGILRYELANVSGPVS